MERKGTIEEICKDYSSHGFHCETISIENKVPYEIWNIDIDVDYINANICSKVTGDVIFRFRPHHIKWYPVSKQDIAGSSAYDLEIKSTGKKYFSYGCALRNKTYRNDNNIVVNFSDEYNYNDEFVQNVDFVLNNVKEYFRLFKKGLMDRLKDSTSPELKHWRCCLGVI